MTDDYVEMAYWALENGRNLDDYIEDDTEEVKNSLEQILHPGEVMEQMDGEHRNYYITNFGRIISLKRMRQITTRFFESGQFTYIHKVKVDWETVFKKNGWEYDVDKIKENYKKYKWNCKIK